MIAPLLLAIAVLVGLVLLCEWLSGSLAERVRWWKLDRRSRRR